jgi:DNA-binding LytR/AlgR family response regulator
MAAERKAVMELTTLVVDDEPAARRRLRSLLETDPEVRIVGECGDGIRAAEMIRKMKPALLFLDVQIPGADGFDVLKEIADRRDLPAVVFVTAHPQYAIPAFEAQALDYLLKPFKRSRFFDVLARAKSHILRNIEFQESQKSGRAPAGLQEVASDQISRPSSIPQNVRTEVGGGGKRLRATASGKRQPLRTGHHEQLPAAAG